MDTLGDMATTDSTNERSDTKKSMRANGLDTSDCMSQFQLNDVCDSGIDSGVGLSMCDGFTLSSCQSMDGCDLKIEIRDASTRRQSLAYESISAEDVIDEFDELKITPTCFAPVKQQPNLRPADDATATPLSSDLCRELLMQDEDGDTKLHLAIIQPDPAATMWIIAATAPCQPLPLNIQNDRFRQTPLHLAVITDQPQIVRMLVICGAVIDVRDRNGNTPLHLACTRGLLNCVKALTLPVIQEELSQLTSYCQHVGLPCFMPRTINTPDLCCKDYEGNSCLHMAQKLRLPVRNEVIHHLVSCGSDVNMQDGKGGESVLQLAVKQRDTDLIQYMCSCGKLDINLMNYSRQTALDIARHLKFYDIADVLLSHGADNSREFYDESSDEECEKMADYELDDIEIDGRRLNYH